MTEKQNLLLNGLKKGRILKGIRALEQILSHVKSQGATNMSNLVFFSVLFPTNETKTHE